MLYLIIKITGTNIGNFFISIGLLRTENVFISTAFGLIFSIIFVYLVGFFVTTFVGRKIFGYGEKLLTKLPIIRGLYTAAKKLTDAIFSQKTAFKRVVFVEFPLEGHYAIGFITTEKKWEINGKKYVNIFIPTTPNPTSGWYLIVPEDRIFYLDLSVEEGLKALISAGIVLPENKDVYKLFKEYIQNIPKK